MPVYKDEVRGSWFVSFYYENAQGEPEEPYPAAVPHHQGAGVCRGCQRCRKRAV